MPRKLLLAATLLIIPIASVAQWQILNTPTTADLRGIHSLGSGIAWASGTNGTVLRTEDNGKTWQPCTTPPDAAKLDFRGIQAFDNKTAIVMSSGPGDLSRLYKTTDGCNTWKLIFTNPDKEGFWDGLVAEDSKAPPILIGDPVGGRFAFFVADNNLANHWQRMEHLGRAPNLSFPTPRSKDESFFAASNSILHGYAYNGFSFVTGGRNGSFFYAPKWTVHSLFDYATVAYSVKALPLAKGESAGAFSFVSDHDCDLRPICKLIAVGGDYKKPDDPTGTAAFTTDGGKTWTAATTPPHGYRSSVTYDTPTKTWITVGPNGTDISTDDGRNWHALKPSPTDQPDADQHWNALSLPFVVGPHGRIGILRPDALQPK